MVVGGGGGGVGVGGWGGGGGVEGSFDPRLKKNLNSFSKRAIHVVQNSIINLNN